jgi:hypothetical protein
MLPGKGNSGFPYIHRCELVRIVRRIIEKSDALDKFEIIQRLPILMEYYINYPLKWDARNIRRNEMKYEYEQDSQISSDNWL